MTDFITTLERELVLAAHRQAPTDAHRGGRLGLRGRRLAAAATVALALPAGAAAAVAVWQPTLGDDTRGHPTSALSQPSAQALGTMAVLRRTETDGDRSASVQKALSLLSPATERGVQTASIRTLGRTSDGRAVVLIPVQGLAIPRSKGEEADPVLRQQLLVFYPDSVDGGGITTASGADVASGRAALGSGLGRVSYGLVADGVASVRVGYSDGRETTVPVHNNFWQATAPQGLSGIDAQATRLVRVDTAGKQVGDPLVR